MRRKRESKHDRLKRDRKRDLHCFLESEVSANLLDEDGIVDTPSIWQEPRSENNKRKKIEEKGLFEQREGKVKGNE